MTVAVAAVGLVAPAVAVPEGGALLAAARGGQLSLQDLMQGALALQQAGHAESAALLYETWITHTASPLRHVACFNWGTVLSTLGRNDAAEAAYQQALAQQAHFAPARLNLGHMAERRGDSAAALEHWRAVFEADPPAAMELRLHEIGRAHV